MSASHLLPQHPMHVPFRSAPVTHAPSPFGFGFGLSNQPSTSSVPPHYSPTQVPQYAAHQHPNSPSHHAFSGLGHLPNARAAGSARSSAKRRHEDTADADSREDAAMNTRSPSPDRPRRVVTKRLRGTDVEADTKARSTETQDSQANIDVGVLLASLPSESLLPLLTSLINAQPSLKPLVLSLIPKPSVQTAVQALDVSAKSLRDAYPYAQSTQAPASTSFGFGSSFGVSASMHAPGSFGLRSANSQPAGAMREDYVRSRIRPSVADFISTATSYLAYFSLLPSPQTPSPQISRPALHDSFTYLCAVTAHIIRAPPLARALLLENAVLFPKLQLEWNAWVNGLDVEVNQNAGMFSAEMVRGWERSLDELTKEGPPSGQIGNMQLIRDKWIEKVGWMVGRAVPKGISNMSEEEHEEL